MPSKHEIRANYDGESIVVYQGYSSAIADPALKAGRFVEPFSFGRMTWIKPSFLWLMHRSNWGNKSGQERTLAVTISRKGWEEALSKAVLTSYEPKAHRSRDDWHRQFEDAVVHVQWDPERTLRGAGLEYFSIQVGISRHLIRTLVDEWILKIEDLTPAVTKIHDLLRRGKADEAKRHLPAERIYPLPAPIGRHLLM
ncbi:DUF4291 domain-containing protein [Luteolibacter soli]|uniref:DUF4291 domain-containing protein n=1 Tax=Luteolibacter soli TaxID=3135280 RepID=A0ABU9B040_9BACT